MELTQRLECTQELYGNRSEPVCPGEIGYLGICGQTYPVKRGPNKIGRDPDTCNIVLKLESISRQHAVINILNNNEYMLMDLGSANKTQLENKILQPYIPYPIRNGDTVQFGKIFGIFRLLEDDNDLPMTQAIDIPETPVRHISKLNNIHGTTIPESPDVSDRDESFIISTQSKVNDLFKSPNNKFIKSSGKIISIQPIGLKKIDNVYWSSSKKSDSFSSNCSSVLNGSVTTVKLNDEIVDTKNIYETETQGPNCQPYNESAESIYNANTQFPVISASPTIHSMPTQNPTINDSVSIKHNQNTFNKDYNESSESIYNANTQISETPLSPFIYGMVTQMPSTKKLSAVSDISTQLPNIYEPNQSSNSIYEANTQIPDVLPLSNMHSIETQIALTKNKKRVTKTQVPHNSDLKESTDSIYNANTQLPENLPSPKFFCKETQMSDAENLPAVCKIQDQQNVQFDLIADNKENVNSIFEPKAQAVADTNLIQKKSKNHNENKNQSLISSVTHNNSDDIILFDEIDSQPLANECESQALLPSDLEVLDQNSFKNNSGTKQTLRKNECAIRSNRLKSDSSTDCEDIDLMMSQRISDKAIDEDLTDCEDEVEFNLVPKQEFLKLPDDDDVTDCEDDQEEKKKFNNSKESNKPVAGTMNFEDLATQIVEGDLACKIDTIEAAKQTDFEDMLTQIVVEDSVNLDHSTVITNIDELATQIISEESNFPKEIAIEKNLTPFKVPLQTSIKSRKRDILKNNTPKLDTLNSNKVSLNNDKDVNYYAATQEILNDLCSQKVPSPKQISKNKITSLNQEISINDNKTTVLNINVLSEKTSDSDVDDKINDFVSNLSSQQIRDVIGVEKGVTKLKKINSDSSSDIEITPKKKRPLRFMEIELPNSQEIKNSVSVTTKNVTTESSSESDTEHDSEQFTPILFRNVKKKTNPARIDLTKMFDIETLPSRVITRVRKPTSKARDSHDLTKNILKPKFLTEQEENIDKEIITENISRLKNKTGKSKPVIEIKKTDAIKEDKSSQNKSKLGTEKKKKERSSSKRSKDKHKKDKIDTKINISGTSSRVTEESNDTIHRSRSTRSGAKSDSNNKPISKSPDKTSASDNTVYSNRLRKKDTEKSKVLPGNETRRSARHKKSEKNHDKETKNNTTNESRHEDSTVYSISSESGIDTPYKLKRPATFDMEIPFSKKLKTDVSISNPTTRLTPMRKVKKQYVLFTAFPCDEVRIKLENLGAVIVTDVSECTVVLTLQIKRTFKLLCAVGLGKPIVGPTWVQACVDNDTVVDPWLYLMKDEATEKRFQFSLQKTLGGKRGFLRGHKVSCTPSVMPSAQEMELIVKCSGGTWKTGGRHWLCVSCSADKHLWPQLQKNGAVVVSTELILGGVLRQKLEIDRNRLA